MKPSDLTTSISNSLTHLDTILASGDPPIGSPQWQQLFALRKHLDDQQRALLQETIQGDDDAFQKVATNLQNATTGLNSAISAQARIDTIINVVSQISSAVDAVLNLG